MDKNNIIGYVLMFLIFAGFLFYNSKQAEKQQALQAYADSVAAVEQARRDSIYFAEHPYDSVAVQSEAPDIRQEAVRPVYKDTLLQEASQAEGTIVTLSNSKLVLQINSKGAQPWSAMLKDYNNYGGSPLYLFREGKSEMGYKIYTGEYINTKDFNFEIEVATPTSVVLSLPFKGGGRIRQEYVLHEDSYIVENTLTFVDMDGVIPKNVSVFDMDWNVIMPRMEKGFKNESQYSKIDYMYPGEKKPSEISGRGKGGAKRIDNKLEWFSFQQQFFSAIMRSEDNFSSGELSLAFLPENNEEHELMSCGAAMRFDVKREARPTYKNEFYFGPNHFQTLKSFDHKYEKIIPLGGWLVGWFTRFVIIPLFNFLHNTLNIANFGIIILLMTIFIKLVVLPFAFKSYSSSASMQALKPEIDKINEKYPKQEDAMKKQQATMDLYKRAGISPMGGCLPMLLKFPILWAMFRFFPASIELRQQRFLWAEDLSAYDSILDFGVNVPLLGDHISLFALLMAVSMFFYSKITTAGQTSGNDPNSKMMRAMSIYMMPIMMFFICNNLSSGLSYYYLLSNLITMLETWIIKKWFVKPEAIMARLKASEGKKVVKSKWQQRLEEAQKMQQQALKEQQKKRR